MELGYNLIPRVLLLKYFMFLPPRFFFFSNFNPSFAGKNLRNLHCISSWLQNYSIIIIKISIICCPSLPISWNKNIIIIFWPIDENESIRLSLFWFNCDILKVFTVICFIPIHLNRALVWSWWIPSKWNVKICSWNSGIWWRWECYDTTFKISHPQKDKAILPQPKTSRTYQSKPGEEAGEEIYH